MNKIIQSCGDKNLDMVFLHWPLTNWCNYKCSYCPVLRDVHNDFKRPDHTVLHNLTLARIKKLSSKFNMCITGGEPTLHPQFKEITESLVHMDNCSNVAIFTNLSRSKEYYKSLEEIKTDKLGVCASFHPEFADSKKFIEKSLIVNKTSLSFSAQVSMTDNEEHWPVLIELMDRLLENDVVCYPILLKPTADFTPNYTDKFYELFRPYMMTTPENRQFKGIDCVFTDGTTGTMKDFDIEIQQMNRFKGYRCTPRTFQISMLGNLENSCTSRRVALNEKDIVKEEICPQEICPARRMLTFYKEKI